MGYSFINKPTFEYKEIVQWELDGDVLDLVHLHAEYKFIKGKSVWLCHGSILNNEVRKRYE